MSETAADSTLLALTAHIVAAYAANNELEANELPRVIHGIYSTLANLGDGPEPQATPIQPAVPVENSVFPDYIICLEDGEKLKMLRRHLFSAYGMTPEQYRRKWNLPHDYPMVAPNYAERRSVLAKEIGLGTSRSLRRSSGRR